MDSVSLFVFPAVTGATAPDDSKCPTINPTIVAYTFPDPPSNTTLPTADTYQVVGFANNYKTTDSATSLNQAAGIVIAAGDSGQSKCTGIKAPGGEGTYYAAGDLCCAGRAEGSAGGQSRIAKCHYSPDRRRRYGVRVEREYVGRRMQHKVSADGV